MRVLGESYLTHERLTYLLKLHFADCHEEYSSHFHRVELFSSRCLGIGADLALTQLYHLYRERQWCQNVRYRYFSQFLILVLSSALESRVNVGPNLQMNCFQKDLPRPLITTQLLTLLDYAGHLGRVQFLWAEFHHLNRHR